MAWTGEGRDTIIWNDTLKVTKAIFAPMIYGDILADTIKADHVGEKTTNHSVVIDNDLTILNGSIDNSDNKRIGIGTDGSNIKINPWYEGGTWRMMIDAGDRDGIIQWANTREWYFPPFEEGVDQTVDLEFFNANARTTFRISNEDTNGKADLKVQDDIWIGGDLYNPNSPVNALEGLKIKYEAAATNYCLLEVQSDGDLNVTSNKASFNVDFNDANLSTTGNVSGGNLTTTDSFFASLGATGTPSYSFTGDTNTGMWSSTAETINFSTAGGERLEIDATEATFTVPITAGNNNITGGTIYCGYAGTFSSVASDVHIAAGGGSVLMDDAVNLQNNNILNGGDINGVHYVSEATSGDILFCDPVNADINIWHISTGTADFGFYMKYVGSGSGNNNALQLWTEGETGTDKQVWDIKQDGQLHIKQLQTQQDITQVFSGTKTLTDASATGFVEIAVATGDLVGGELMYTMYIDDGTDLQAHTGGAGFVAVNKAGTVTSNCQETYLNPSSIKIVTAGTLSDTLSCTNGAGKITLNFNANTSLNVNITLKYTIRMHSLNVITAL